MTLQMEETAETQQLMQNEIDEEEAKVAQLPTSPVVSVKMSSSGAASQTSRTPGQTFTGNNSLSENPRVAYINERKAAREPTGRSTYSNRPRNIHKEAPDVKHMEKALLELLDDFHTGKLKAFGPGCSMEQMMDIRDQQEHLARLHFRLGADQDKVTIDGDTLCHSSKARENMSQLVQSLEQLSNSIEQLHSGDLIPSSNVFKDPA